MIYVFRVSNKRERIDLLMWIVRFFGEDKFIFIILEIGN